MAMRTLVNATVVGLRLLMPVFHARYEAYPINAYNVVQAGPKTHGGGRRGGCRSAIYVFWVFLGRAEKPMAVPAATGRRMAAAALSKMADGMVIEGM